MSANALIELEDLEVSNKKRSLWIKFIVKFILCLVRTIFGIFYFLHYWHHKNEKYSFKSELRKWELFFFLFINVLIRQISFWALLIYFISN
jgi:heme/copper-type cytochrome/quinol oxidase subunit 4